MSSSWSNLPLDLLISIRNKLQTADLLSFRSVCSQWRYASPIPNQCPLYEVDFNNEKKNIQFTLSFDGDIILEYFIYMPFSSSSPISFFGCSNGWLIFITPNNKALHLFDPVSDRKLIFPPLYPKLLRYYKKVKPRTVHGEYCFYLRKVVVSSSINRGIAVAGIVDIFNRSYSRFLDRRTVLCWHAPGDCQRWSFLMEDSKGIIDICLAGDGRFYAIGEPCKFYMLDERPPLIKLKKIKLWLPKHFLDSGSDNSLPAKRLPTTFHSLKASGETDLYIYGNYLGLGFEWLCVFMKINLAELHGNSNNIEVACDDARWSYRLEDMQTRTSFFRPLLSENHSMFSLEHRIKNELDLF